jgi:bifunctional DNase/RNase
MNHFPKKRLSLQKIQNLHTPEELERIELKYNKLMYHPPSSQVVMILEADEKTVGYPLSDFEGAMASFIFLGCAKNAHILTIHQMYVSLLKEIKSQIVSAVVESKQGDMYYATLEYIDRNGNKFRTVSSFADALMLTHLTGTKLYVLRKVLDEIEDFKDWTYFSEIFDDEMDD